MTKVYRILESQSYLYFIQRKLINKKNKISKYNEIQRIPWTYPYKAFTHWDSILCK